MSKPIGHSSTLLLLQNQQEEDISRPEAENAALFLRLSLMWEAKRESMPHFQACSEYLPCPSALLAVHQSVGMPTRMETSDRQGDPARQREEDRNQDHPRPWYRRTPDC